MIQAAHGYNDVSEVFSNDSPEKFYLLGLFSTQSYIWHGIDKSSIILSVGKANNILLNDVLLKDIEKFLKISDSIIYEDSGSALYFNSNKFIEILKLYGFYKTKENKIVLTKEIPEEFILSFLHGCFDNGGVISKTKLSLFKTMSKTLAEQLVNLYRRINYKVNLVSHVDEFYVQAPFRVGLKILRDFYKQHVFFLPSKYETYLRHIRITPDDLMMELAHNVAKRSTCIRGKVGCVITNKEKTNVEAIGYNGQAKGLHNHCQSVFKGACGCVHAEENALIKGNGPILYCTTAPCPNCARIIINANVKEVYYSSVYRKSEGIDLLVKAGIKINIHSRKNYIWKLNW